MPTVDNRSKMGTSWDISHCEEAAQVIKMKQDISNVGMAGLKDFLYLDSYS